MSDALQDLLHEIQCMQCLVYMGEHPWKTSADPTPIREMMDELRISPEECGRVVNSLAREGFIQPVGRTEHSLPQALLLTQSGQEHLKEWRKDMPTAGRGVR